MTKHFRAPIFDTFRNKSPLAGLGEHAAKIHECIAALQETTAAFTNGEHDKIYDMAMNVSALELAADEIKSNIRNHLPANVRMPVDKALFLQALSSQDGILDQAEDAAIWMSMRQTKVSPEIAEGLIKLMDKVAETIVAYGAAVDNLADLMETGFVRREREQEKVLVHRVHELEHDTDVLSAELSRLLMQPETEASLGPMGCYHLLKLTLQISKIADYAENAADRLRAMLSR